MNVTYRHGEIILDPFDLSPSRRKITCRSDVDYEDSLDLVCVYGGEGAVQTEIVLAPGFTPDELDSAAQVMCQRPDDLPIEDDGTCQALWFNDHFVVIFIYKIDNSP